MVALLTAMMSLAVQSHSLHDVDIQVMINDKGHARIVETRHFTIGENGTEAYLRMYNLGVMEFGDLQVTDETGVKYDFEKSWDIERSREEKTHRCGIYQGDDGPEICWGLGEMGERTYVVRYTLTRLVKAYDDYDGFNHNFYEASTPWPKHVKVTIMKQEGQFTKEDTRIWAFGFHGVVNVVDGKIVAETIQPMAADGEKVTVMARWNKGVFHPVTNVNEPFSLVQKRAFIGSDYTYEEGGNTQSPGKASLFGSGRLDDSGSGIWRDLANIFGQLIGVLLLVLLPLVIIGGIYTIVYKVKKHRHFKRLFGNKKGEPQQLSRAIPFGGDLNRAKAVMNAVEQNNNNDLVAAYILRMIYQGYLTVGRMVDDHGNTIQVLGVLKPGLKPKVVVNEGDDTVARMLQQLLWNASGEDQVLEPDEFTEYMRNDPVQHRAFVKELLKNIERTPYMSLKNLSSEDANAVFGLKKYLQEFTLSSERNLGEVALWKEYMVYATLFGIAKQVGDDLRKVWPDNALTSIDDVIVDQDSMTSITWAALANRNIHYVDHYETPEERQQRMARERRSGGGGSSSFGGGGGYSGGGGSGIR